jgi:predicted  nucleic acid-binding Zn-ribbon protein
MATTSRESEGCMSEGLKERFINALTATIVLFEETGEEHAKRIEKLENTVLRMQGEHHELELEVGRLREDIKEQRKWLHAIVEELPEAHAVETSS